MNGILLVDKPPDWTSHDVVAKLRGICGIRRIGHSGTLDPMATGLLVVFIGRATRAVEFAESHEKEYRAALRLGFVTDTLDTTGTVLSQTKANVSREELEAVLPGFRGEIDQLPPMYSAIKINGKKLYDIARAGGEVERKTRRVTISKLECTGQTEHDFLLDITCSKGTYIRSLCADIGSALGCGASMSALRRTRAGEFSIEHAHSIAEIQSEGAEGFLLPVDTLFKANPALYVDEWAEKRIKFGADFDINTPDGEYRVYSEEGVFLMLGRVTSGVMSTIKSFFEV